MRAVSLFSGCGGLDIGVEAAGVHVALANDVSAVACETLRARFPRTEVFHGDVAALRDVPTADLLVGGYPCQSFSMGGLRNPKEDERTYLYLHYARVLAEAQPKYFIAENVDGLRKIQNGSFLDEQLSALSAAGPHGYRITAQVLDAKQFGIPQTRKRLLIVGVRRDLNAVFEFPAPTHGKATKRGPVLLPFASHGEAIAGMEEWPTGDFYERPHDETGHFSWYYMSRNRKAKWAGPAYTVVANWRHITLHPCGPVMTLTWSNLADGWKQRWDFSDEFEHVAANPDAPVLRTPRRLSWRECARIQTFPVDFEPAGRVEAKFTQIGNAVPPKLAEQIVRHLVTERGLRRVAKSQPAASASKQITLWS